MGFLRSVLLQTESLLLLGDDGPYFSEFKIDSSSRSNDTQGVGLRMSTRIMSIPKMSTPKMSTPKMSISQNIISQNANFSKCQLYKNLIQITSYNFDNWNTSDYNYNLKSNKMSNNCNIALALALARSCCTQAFSAPQPLSALSTGGSALGCNSFTGVL